MPFVYTFINQLCSSNRPNNELKVLIYSFYTNNSNTQYIVYGAVVMTRGVESESESPGVRILARPPFGAGAPLFSPCPFTYLPFPFLLLPFFHWLYLFSSFVHPFPFYQNSCTPFSGRRS